MRPGRKNVSTARLIYEGGDACAGVVEGDRDAKQITLAPLIHNIAIVIQNFRRLVCLALAQSGYVLATLRPRPWTTQPR